MAADQKQSAPDSTSSSEVADPEGYNQQERLRSINQARERVEDTIQDSMVRLRTDAEFTESDRQQVVRAALYPYLTSVEWLMAESGNKDLLQDRELGTLTIQPPTQLQRLADEGRVVGDPNLQPLQQTISGIHGYITAPEVFRESWTVTVRKRHSGPTEVNQVKETFMPVHISKNAFRMVNRFLNQAGVDISLHEDQHRAVVDEEVMEEVEEWREQNV